MFDEGLFWEDPLWSFSNLDDEYSGGNIEEKSGKKLIESKEKEVAPPEEKKKKSTTVGCKKGKRKVDQGSEEKGGGDEGGGNGGGEGGESDHETHIFTERERRKRMKNMFSNLHALLPQLPPKADKSSIVDEAVSYIRTLQHTLQNLHRQKLERLQSAITMNHYNNNNNNNTSIIIPQKLDKGSSSSSKCSTFQSWNSPNVSLDVCGDDANISVCSAKKAGLLSAICFVFNQYKLEVVSAQVSSDHFRSMYMFQVHANAGGGYEAFPAEERFKQAAEDIIFNLMTTTS